MKRAGIFILIFLLLAIMSGCSSIDEKMEKGHFKMAKTQINNLLAGDNVPDLERIALEEKKDIMHRIELDFNKSLDDILPDIKKYYPEVTSEQLRAWGESKALEKMKINGEDRYFARSARNLFRIDKDAKAQMIKIDGEKKDELVSFLEQNLPSVIEDVKNSKGVTGKSLKIKFTYTLTVDADAVPAGEMIRCWLPFPREGNVRQQDVKLLSTNMEDYILAPNSQMQRTLYMQKPAVAGQPTIFEIAFSTTTRPQWFDLENAEIKSYDKNSEIYKTYTKERNPHLLFTPAVKALSEKIVGDEKDPYQIVKKIFNHITSNYPWAGAREYSTIENIPEYVIANNHGDCGQVTLLFMVLARYNGIPARWQSGWMLHPGNKNLHDWCEIYFEGPGWVPVDQSFGRQEVKNPEVQGFFLGGLDTYRLIVNDDYGMQLFPAKQFLRSETVDFQRGEVEWRGGNLYFNQWDYHLELEYLNQ
ncbi:MAG: transglutaminase-like domain-containing protein [Candidatus Marinimicrobia bacterium]|nr:transglutaminase-like domain-containing protein [Candidatus Neomarinimicrobiota bacterium]